MSCRSAAQEAVVCVCHPSILLSQLVREAKKGASRGATGWNVTMPDRLGKEWRRCTHDSQVRPLYNKYDQGRKLEKEKKKKAKLDRDFLDFPVVRIPLNDLSVLPRGSLDFSDDGAVLHALELSRSNSKRPSASG